MELKYGNSSTYSLSLEEGKLGWLCFRFNRSKSQIHFLFNLLGGTFEEYQELELKIKNNFIYYCPTSKEELNKILDMKSEGVFKAPNKYDYELNNHEFKVSEVVYDKVRKENTYITQKTTTSIEVFHSKIGEHGIDCSQFYDMREFNKRFEKVK